MGFTTATAGTTATRALSRALSKATGVRRDWTLRRGPAAIDLENGVLYLPAVLGGELEVEVDYADGSYDLADCILAWIGHEVLGHGEITPRLSERPAPFDGSDAVAHKLQNAIEDPRIERHVRRTYPTIGILCEDMSASYGRRVLRRGIDAASVNSFAFGVKLLATELCTVAELRDAAPALAPYIDATASELAALRADAGRVREGSYDDVLRHARAIWEALSDVMDDDDDGDDDDGDDDDGDDDAETDDGDGDDDDDDGDPADDDGGDDDDDADDGDDDADDDDGETGGGDEGDKLPKLAADADGDPREITDVIDDAADDAAVYTFNPAIDEVVDPTPGIDDVRGDVRKTADVLSRRLAQALSRRGPRRVRGQRSGRFDARRASAALSGTASVFSRRRERPGGTDVAVAIALDASYSMNGVAWDRARRSTMGLMLALDAIGVPSHVSSFTTFPTPKCGSDFDPARYDDDDALTRQVGVKLCDLKGWNDDAATGVRNINGAKVGWLTPTAEALSHAADALLDHPAERKVLLFATDGEPIVIEEVTEEEYTAYRRHVGEVIDAVQAAGIELVIIGMGRCWLDATTEYASGPVATVEAPTVADLQDAAGEELIRRLNEPVG